MKTPLIAAYSQEDQDMLSSIRPSKRLISVDNVAESILFMCSDYAIDAVGSILSMDGGYTAQ